MNQIDRKRGLTLVYTGDGQGKTTATMGLALRAHGRKQKVLMNQFNKSARSRYGEREALSELGIELVQTGIGFTWTKTPKEHREALKKAWEMTKGRIMEGKHDLIILDEINNALAINKFPINDVLPL